MRYKFETEFTILKFGFSIENLNSKFKRGI